MFNKENSHRNYFGQDIPAFRSIFDKASTAQLATKLLKSLLRSLDINDLNIEYCIERLVSLCQSEIAQDIYELKINKFLFEISNSEKIRKALNERATIAQSQVSSFLKPGTVLDLGCGDGLIAQKLSKLSFEVTLADVYKHPRIDSTNLAFNLIEETGKLPYQDKVFDNVLLYTVLHHAIDPIHTLKEAKRVCKPDGNLLITESLFGAHTLQRHETPYSQEMIGLSEIFMSLSLEEQFKVDMYFDHFFNRCLFFSHNHLEKISVPYNYISVEGWETLFAKEGLFCSNTINFGIDQRLAPLFHTLFVLQNGS